MAAREKGPWRRKLEKDDDLPRTVPVPPKWQKAHGKGSMLIARPLDVDQLVRGVRKGRLVTVRQIREQLAADHGADVTCPLTTGIFVRIVAEAAEEERAAGRKRIAPWWRVVDEDGRLKPKLPGGGRLQAALLREEGHVIEVGKGTRPPRVKDLERKRVRTL